MPSIPMNCSNTPCLLPLPMLLLDSRDREHPAALLPPCCTCPQPYHPSFRVRPYAPRKSEPVPASVSHSVGLRQNVGHYATTPTGDAGAAGHEGLGHAVAALAGAAAHLN